MSAASYAELVRRSKEIGVVNSCAAVLGWDQQTCMPRKGADLRGEQLAFLAGLAHQKATDPKFGERARRGRGSRTGRGPDSSEAANVREVAADLRPDGETPAALVEELARVTTQAQQAWQEAKKANDFPTFRPWLEKVVALKRQEADAVGYTGPPLRRAARASTSPARPSAELKTLFAGLTAELVPLIKRIAESPRKPPTRGSRTRVPRRTGRRLLAESAAVAIGLRLRGGPARHHVAPVLLRDRAGRLPHHHAVQPAVLQRGVLRRAARDRARAVRAEPAGRALRHPARVGVLPRHPRVAVAAVGEPGRSRPAVLGALLPAPEADVPRRAGGRTAGRLLLRRQRRAAVAHPRGGRRGDVQPARRPAVRDRDWRCCPAI